MGQPFDVVQVRLQTTAGTSSGPQFKGPLHCLRTTVAREGVAALWKGGVPQIILSIPYSSIMFTTYEYLKPVAPDADLHRDPHPTAANAAGAGAGGQGDAAAQWRAYYRGVFAAGAGTGLVLTLAQNPLDVWRTKLQTNYGWAAAAAPAAGKSTSAAAAQPARAVGAAGMLREILASANTGEVLMRGVSLTFLRNTLGNGVFFTCYEFTTRLYDTQQVTPSHPAGEGTP